MRLEPVVWACFIQGDPGDLKSPLSPGYHSPALPGLGLPKPKVHTTKWPKKKIPLICFPLFEGFYEDK